MALPRLPEKTTKAQRDIEDEAMRLSRNIICSVIGEACCCCSIFVPLALVWATELPDLISRGRYGAALYAVGMPVGFLAPFLAKWYIGIHGAKTSNPKKLDCYRVLNGLCLVPLGVCTWILFMAGWLAVGMAHSTHSLSPKERYIRYAVSSVPGLLMLLLIFFQGTGASAAQSLSSHVLAQPPASPAVAANSVGKAETHAREPCDEMKDCAQFCGECGDEADERV